MSKGDKDRGSQAKRRQSKLWCERCGYGKSACRCKQKEQREHGKQMMDVLMCAMGYKRVENEEE